MRQDVQQWFTTRSYHGSQWSAEQLCRRKRGSTVSVVLPARNEAETVGAIVTALRRTLMEDVALIDELVVIDSDSTDGTGAVAAAAGARVHRQADILPAHGNVPGKGEALWKSLAVTTGDVLAFVDSDLREFDPQFAVGLLGPLLTEPGVQFVKSCYDRPLHDGATVMPAGGGRVTELVARPLLNLFWPQLAGLVQPLAGEYAGRRSLLERVPFVSGYGVEIAMLIDVLEAVGLDAMAQVDLGVRSHRNSSDAALARMAAQIQLTVQARLRCDSPVADESGRLTQFLRQGERFLAEVHDVSVRERPPMVQVPEYRAQPAGRVA
ncbi:MULTISPECIES: glucosyl-3-phosphoglycerate synthase [Kocuria]|uniref:Glucosyl-3-phosphoglycerate synthase n=1 Tax=Kocuria rosea subsp. polaris TaxID=136273 RepID=A0A0A6VVD0_KOCRO|nr:MULTISPECIES: glucosyl-3-phosphoglycerate synthase [Kocuria]MCC5781635.1 glucosyl-3-phosphoglycerate synthase [Kocuria sp. CCUG 69068]EYT48245.1 glucosyl-3-phosphoglycerate synthase [Kocuria sp. UCD-OTCP]KHD98581.1 glucosyl-3-phosphoglycerate synthase [Kocuria polaris]NVC23827.1 glucosyl-3-phosphoglycerate synthase [Kocuria salina]PAU88628.1 glucosyl-3-phosphoglycerate synthase [Kocuria sp. WN036]